MDSFTQIILGAAVGEVVLGRKAGNRAMLWGGIGGTIPDLDILANFVSDEMTALAFHRGITHSFFFAFVGPLLFGYLVHRLYASGVYLKKGYRGISTVFWMLLYLLSATGLSFLPVMAGGDFSPTTLVILLIGGILVAWHLWRNYYQKAPPVLDTSLKDWYLVFFWAIFTHPLLDSCTAFGTQLFQPFSDYRVALNTISVVDPIYTLPFLICLIIAAWYFRGHPRRRFFNWLGIILSCIYLAITAYRKIQVDRVFEAHLKTEQIDYHRFMTSPTIFNNIVWNCIAEGDSTFYQGLYSTNDTEPYFEIINIFPKNHELVSQYEGDRSLEILQWFSNGYWNILEREDGGLQLNDLRYGVMGNQPRNEKDYVFRFLLSEDEAGGLEATQSRENPDRPDRALGELFERMRGN